MHALIPTPYPTKKGSKMKTLSLPTGASSSAAAAAAMASSLSGMFPASGSGAEGGAGGAEMDDQDMSRLQAMLEARGFPPHLAGLVGPRSGH